MNEQTKMIAKLIGLGVITFAIGAGMFFLFFGARPKVTPVVETPSATSPTGGLPTAGAGTPIVPSTMQPSNTGTGNLQISRVANGGLTSSVTLTTSAIKSPTITSAGTVAYYDPGDGKFYSIDDKGNVVALSEAKFPEAETVTFAQGGTEAALEFPDGTNVIYDFDKATQVTLPAHWEAFSFSADGDTVTTKSIATDPSARSLVVASADGSTATPVAALGTNQNKVTVNMSPDGSILGFSATGNSISSTFGQNGIFLIDKNGDDAGVLYVSGTNFTAKWSPDSAHLIYSVADASQDYKATLWYADKDGDQKTATRKQLPLNTLTSKCVFASNSTIYCAVPTVMPVGGGSAASLLTSPDNLYKIDLNTLKASLVAVPSVSTQMSNLSISPSGTDLFYSDKFGRLNVMKLK